jgi:polyisoprenoid-binding protein YceI
MKTQNIHTGKFLKIAYFILVLGLTWALSYKALAQEAVVDISLSPAGSFKVKSTDVKGSAIVAGDKVSAESIEVNLQKVETGVSLRDEHTRKHLEVEKFPTALLTKATGEGGKGQGHVKIHGVEKDITGSYSVKDDKLTADFVIKLSDFGITGIKYMGVGVKDEATIHVTVPIKK